MVSRNLFYICMSFFTFEQLDHGARGKGSQDSAINIRKFYGVEI